MLVQPSCEFRRPNVAAPLPWDLNYLKRNLFSRRSLPDGLCSRIPKDLPKIGYAHKWSRS